MAGFRVFQTVIGDHDGICILRCCHEFPPCAPDIPKCMANPMVTWPSSHPDQCVWHLAHTQVTNVETTHYILGSVAGPHPFPMMVRDFQSVIGKETRAQCMVRLLPCRAQVVVVVFGQSCLVLGLGPPESCCDRQKITCQLQERHEQSRHQRHVHANPHHMCAQQLFFPIDLCLHRRSGAGCQILSWRAWVAAPMQWACSTSLWMSPV